MSIKDAMYSTEKPIPEYGNFELYNFEVKTNGFVGLEIEGSLYKIYNPELALIILGKVELKNLYNENDTRVNGWEVLFPSFKEGYDKGKQYFADKFKPSLDVLYSSNNKMYLRNLHDKYFHTGNEAGIGGWQQVKFQRPVTFNKTTIFRLGYYSGIVSEVDELMSENDVLRLEFERCEDEKKDSKTKLSLKQVALIYVYSDKQITEHNGNEIAEKHGWKSGRRLWQDFNFYHPTVNRIGVEDSKKKTKNKITLIESVIELLPLSKQEKAKDEIAILKTRYNSEYR